MKKLFSTHLKNRRYFPAGKKGRKGFTLAEVLLVVAILGVLIALGVPAVFTIRKNLRQTELDAKAETLYMAVQNRMSKMKAAGKADAFGRDAEGVADLPDGDLPDDADTETAEAMKGEIVYFASSDLDDADTAAYAVMTDSSMDASLVSAHWVVEYNPSSAIVYAVFYSEDPTDCAAEYENISKYSDYDSYYRYRKQRLAAGAKVGYYGGGSADSGSEVKEITPTLTIVNAEKLTAQIRCMVPKDFEGAPVFKIEMEDTAGNKYTAFYAYEYSDKLESAANGAPVYVGKNPYGEEIEKDEDGRTFTLNLTLDDLTEESSRFVNRYGKSENQADTTKLLCGTPLKITVTAMCPGNNTVTGTHSASVITNSLFSGDNCVDDSGDLNAAYGTCDAANVDNAAVIVYGRHLQNLDQSSGVVSSITYAEQGFSIAFTDVKDQTGVEDWYETYHKDDAEKTGYFNGYCKDGTTPNFKPITNTNLTDFNGSSFTISGLSEYGSSESTSDLGLFSVLSGGKQTIENVTMTGTYLITEGSGTSVGAIAGLVTGSAAITDCRVYLTGDDIGSGTEKKTNEYIWISGTKAAGGLIGAVSAGQGKIVTVDIKESSCSSVIGSYAESAVTRDTESESDLKPIVSINSFTTDVAGGLIGSVEGNAVVNISESYADNYLAGTVTGGLVGQGSAGLTIDSCYAAGFMSFKDSVNSAGLVRKAANITKSYSVARGLYLKEGVTLSIKTSECTSDSVINFATPDDVSEAALAKLNGSADDSEVKFELKTGIEVYKLCGQTNTYGYPVLKAVAQYGDCDIDTSSYDPDEQGFHFSSDYLKEGGAEWNVVDWSSGIDIQIFNYETDNLYNVSEEDITYKVTVTGGWIQSVGGKTSTSYTISKGPDRLSQTLHITPPKTAAGESVTVTVTSTAPYSRTLSATFNLAGKNTPDYTVRNQGDGSVLITVKSNGYSGKVTIKWNSSSYTPDNAEKLLRNFVNSTVGSDGLSYGTITVDSNSTYSFRFISLSGAGSDGAETVDSQGSGTTITLK